MMEGKIRLAKKNDVKKITNLFNSSKNLWGNDKIKYDDEDIDDYMSLRINKFIVYEINKKIVGVLLAQFWKNYVYLHTIVISEKYQRKGIATKLMNYLEHSAKAEGKQLIEMEVKSNNKKMKKILKKRNYAQGNKLIYYYKK